MLTPHTPLDEAAKCALISMDSTLRSNLSVGLPLDLLVYERDTLRVTRYVSLDQSNSYFQMIHTTWGARLRQVFGEIPDPLWTDEGNVPRHERATLPSAPRATHDGHVPEPRPAQTLAQAQPGAAATVPRMPRDA